MTNDHLARLVAMISPQGNALSDRNRESIAWAVKTIREQDARIAELERLNDASVRSMKFAKETMDLGTETIDRLRGSLDYLLAEWVDPENLAEARAALAGEGDAK